MNVDTIMGGRKNVGQEEGEDAKEGRNKQTALLDSMSWRNSLI